MKLTKYIAYVLFTGMMAGAFSSCKKYLDVTPDNIATIENAFTMRKEAEKYLFTCYSYLPSHGTRFQVQPPPTSRGYAPYETPPCSWRRRKPQAETWLRAVFNKFKRIGAGSSPARAYPILTCRFVCHSRYLIASTPF